MKVFISSGSPYARKCRIVVREKNLLSQVEEIVTAPMDNLPDLLSANPLAQIPAFVTDEGTALSDSALICAYLDAHYTGGVTLMPQDERQWGVRRLEVLANGIMEMAVKQVLELRRPQNERSATWLKRWQDNMLRAISVAEAHCPPADHFDMGSLTLAVAATYTSFRFPDLDWQSAAPKLAALTLEHEKRQSFVDTYPKL